MQLQVCEREFAENLRKEYDNKALQFQQQLDTFAKQLDIFNTVTEDTKLAINSTKRLFADLPADVQGQQDGDVKSPPSTAIKDTEQPHAQQIFSLKEALSNTKSNK
jgi:hypothetical protein